MSDQFYISFADIDNKRISSLGVYRGTVNPPSYHTCKINEKNFTRLFYITKGKTIFDKGKNTELIAGKGDIVFLPDNITYISEWDTSEKGEYMVLHFTIDTLHIKMPSKICIASHDHDGIYLKMFENAYKICSQGRLGYRLELMSVVYKIIHNLYCETSIYKMKSEYRNIYPAILYLENHYTENITVNTLAAMCNMSEGNFRRYFKKYSDMSPITYRNYLRIKRSFELLKSGEFNVSEAASMVNIDDICYFHKLFKRVYGVSPKKIMLHSE